MTRSGTGENETFITLYVKISQQFNPLPNWDGFVDIAFIITISIIGLRRIVSIFVVLLLQRLALGQARHGLALSSCVRVCLS